ncbi:DNA helicase [Bacillus sp. AFS076308]|nr:DNA helicase [Bacillus sp. AFS076308]
MPDKTLRKIEEDIKNGDLGKARDRLHGLISTYPDELELRRKLGDIYSSLKYPTMAGRYWYLEEDKTPEMEKACAVFEKSEGNNPYRISRTLKFKGNPEIIQKLQLDPGYSPIKEKVKERLLEEPADTFGDRLVTIGCFSIFILIVCFILIGIYTVFRWIF